ncbi:MAG: DUF5103 domain-containing protein [bacterium]|jgi:hypothetical protein
MLRSSFFLFFLFLFFLNVNAQRLPDEVYMPSIKTIKFTKFGDQLSYPVIALNSTDMLELNFDDLDGGVKSYYYTIVLCNADWTPAQMSYFDYVKGYTQVRITTYRTSAISLTRYTHYQANLPDRNCIPTKSGNYMLKVFLDGDTSKLAFTKRFLVVDQKINMAATVLQPFNQQFFQTHHRLQVHLDTKNFDIRYPQQQLKVRVLQNYRWDNSLQLSLPTFVRQDMLQYSNENEMVMPAGKEYRWLNLRSFRLLGDRVKRQQNTDSSFILFVKEEVPRLPRQYHYYRDFNGMYINETTESINPYWNADYAKVHFSFRPPGSVPYPNADLVLMGELSNYGKERSATLVFNPDLGVYETSMFLKQGYYDYQYVLRSKNNNAITYSSTFTENDTWETENAYLVLVYFRDLGGRYDQLIAVRQISSQFNKPLR